MRNQLSGKTVKPMKAICKWCAKHQTLATILYAALVLPAGTYLLHDVGCPLWGIVLVDLVLLLISLSFSTSCLNRVMKDSFQSLYKDCDPAPALQTSSELLQYKQPESSRQVLLINYCVALREMGEYQKALDILSSINIDKCSGTLPVTKVTYYNNLSDIYDLLEDPAQSEIWYSKMMQIYKDMPNNSFKKALGSAVSSATAAHLYRIGNYEEVIPVLKQMKTEDLAHNIDSALLWAKTSLQLQDTQTAKKQLQYVIENGNRLYAVTVAQDMLDAMQ